jgi:hypothetical protein
LYPDPEQFLSERFLQKGEKQRQLDPAIAVGEASKLFSSFL